MFAERGWWNGASAEHPLHKTLYLTGASWVIYGPVGRGADSASMQLIWPWFLEVLRKVTRSRTPGAVLSISMSRVGQGHGWLASWPHLSQ